MIRKTRDLTKISRGHFFTRSPDGTESHGFEYRDVPTHWEADYGDKESYKSYLQTYGCKPYRMAASSDWSGKVRSRLSWEGHQDFADGTDTTYFNADDALWHHTAAVAPEIIDTSDTLDDCRRKLVEKAIDAHTNGLALGVDLAETGKTFKMVAPRIKQLIGVIKNPLSTAKQFVGSVRVAHELIARGMIADYRDANSRLLKRVRKSKTDSSASVLPIHNWWAEARFGWGPLWGSLDAALYTVAHKGLGQNGPTLVQARNKSFAREERVMDSRLMSIVSLEFVARERIDQEVKVLSQGWYDLKGINDLRSVVGEYPEIAWELVPFSFVIDRFFDFGGWLKRQSAHRLKERLIQEGYTYEIKLTTSLDVLRFKYPTMSFPFDRVTGSGKFESTRVFYKRDAAGSEVHGMTINLGVKSLTHATDYLALVAQQFGKGRKFR